MAAANFPLTGAFQECPTTTFLTNRMNVWGLELDKNTSTQTQLVADNYDYLLGHGFSPILKRIVGSSFDTGHMFFAGPSLLDPGVISIDLKPLPEQRWFRSGDIISTSLPGSTDMYYTGTDPTHIIIPLSDLDALEFTHVEKTGYTTTGVFDLAFVDSGSYGADFFVWFAVVPSGTDMRLLRGLIDNSNPLLPTVNVTDEGILTILAGSTVPVSAIYDAAWADAENQLYVSSTPSGSIYRIDVSDPATPVMEAHEIGTQLVQTGADASRCRFATLTTTTTTTTSYPPSDVFMAVKDKTAILENGKVLDIIGQGKGPTIAEMLESLKSKVAIPESGDVTSALFDKLMDLKSKEIILDNGDMLNNIGQGKGRTLVDLLVALKNKERILGNGNVLDIIGQGGQHDLVTMLHAVKSKLATIESGDALALFDALKSRSSMLGQGDVFDNLGGDKDGALFDMLVALKNMGGERPSMLFELPVLKDDIDGIVKRIAERFIDKLAFIYDKKIHDIQSGDITALKPIQNIVEKVSYARP